MSGVMLATCMQPSIPVITALLGVVLGLEAGSVQKFVGILVAVAGSICMVSNSTCCPETPGCRQSGGIFASWLMLPQWVDGRRLPDLLALPM